MTSDKIPQQHERIGNYVLLRPIGRGGFATVYLGRHVHLRSYAAIKILHARLGTMEEIEMFRREAQTIAQLAHPNIVRVLDFDVYDNDLAVLIMDYAPYGSLHQQYKLGTRVPLPAIISYVNQVASALNYAHQHRIIHRDVKPENMLVAKDNRILLSDFGIAALMAAGSSRAQTGEAAGTVAYMAPEQIHGKPRPESDQYALAVSTYEWICGESPFVGTMTEVIGQHLSATPPSPRSYAPDLSPAVERVLLKALSKDPAQRFASILGFSKALARAAGVTPRTPEEEQFLVVSRTERSSRSTIAIPGDVKGSSRELASIPTMRARPEEQSLQIAQRPPRRKLFSRRAILFGTVALVGAGSVAATMSALRQAPAAPAHPMQTSIATQIGQGSTATTSLMDTPTKNSMQPTTEATATPGSAEQPVSQPQPTQPPPPPPTPTPTPLIPTGQLYAMYKGHTSVVFSVAWSPNSTRVASGGGDQTAQVWHAADGGMITVYRKHAAAVTCVAWSPDGRRVASASDDKTIQVWDAITGSTIYTCIGHTASVHSVSWSPDGKQLVSGSTDRTIRVWDAANGRQLLVDAEHLGTIWGVAWSRDGRSIASCSSDHTVRILDSTTGISRVAYSSSDVIGNVAWSPDGRRIVSAGNNTNVDVWISTTGTLLTSYIGHAGIAYGVAWSPDGRSIASGSEDRTVAVFDSSQGSARYIYRGHSSYVFGVAWSPDGSRIASGSDDHTVHVWF